MQLSNKIRLSVMLWCMVIVVGVALAARFDGTAGTGSQPPITWPENKLISLDSHRDTLLMFLHPHCPCSAASLTDLSKLMTSFKSPPAAYLVNVVPPGASVDWAQSELIESAKTIAHVIVLDDVDGKLAAQFATATSGDVILYSGRGQLLFHGGITPSRGHPGDSIGGKAIADLVNGNAAAVSSAPVFGCPLCGGNSCKTNGSNP